MHSAAAFLDCWPPRPRYSEVVPQDLLGRPGSRLSFPRQIPSGS